MSTRLKDTSTPTPVRTLAEAVLHRLGGADRARLTRLWQHWDMVLGQELASLALPLGHKDSVLLLGAEDSMTMQEISLLAPEILERVNAFMDSVFFRTATCGLLLGRCPLNIISPLPTLRHIPLAHDTPHPLHGRHLASMRPDSPVAQCYARFTLAHSPSETPSPHPAYRCV